jgi:N-acetylglucosamine-6-sulfatase
MKFHGVWDCYELYDLDEDPEEMNNLLGGYRVTREGGTLDNLINQTAPPELKELFQRMQQLLAQELEATGCRPEPVW